ncbi:MAG: DNA starvation/stationary phase protection protein Dps [Sandaracinaceae bacterium]
MTLTSRIDLADKVRTPMIQLLNERLADTLDLYMQSKQAHWNVEGPSFIALHELFDDVADHAAEWADTVAERVRALGGTAEGTRQAVTERSTLPEYPRDLSSGRGHVDRLAAALADYGAKVRRAIDAADEVGDKDTADLFTEVSRGVDKDLWFVEAHLGAA